MRLDRELQLVFIDNCPPIIAGKVPWFEDPALQSKGVNLHAPKPEQPHSEPQAQGEEVEANATAA